METENFDLINVSSETTAIETSPGTVRSGIITLIHKSRTTSWLVLGVQAGAEAVSLCPVVLSQRESKREVIGRSGEPAQSGCSCP